jgi:hypothetical protein
MPWPGSGSAGTWNDAALPCPPQEQKPTPARRRSWRDGAEPEIDALDQGCGWRGAITGRATRTRTLIPLQASCFLCATYLCRVFHRPISAPACQLAASAQAGPAYG